MLKTIKVGNNEKKEVSELNNQLFKNARDILEDNMHLNHIGWSGVGNFIDWLESNYTITSKED